jgi:flavin reductase (DIM6/NTAB) family NADH-FMN oxidoreductase RutF
VSDPFERIVASLEYPMFVVTVAAGGERSGALVGFAAQCSIDPPRFCVWLSKANHTFGVAQNADVLVVHALRATDHELARLFGEETGDKVDKFARCDWDDGPGGAPVLRGCDYFAGRIVDRTDTGDHVAHVLELIGEGDASHADEPQLGFQAVRDLDAGHSS